MQYEVIFLPVNNIDNQINKTLNKEGDDGWELVTVCGDIYNFPAAFFKKQKEL